MSFETDKSELRRFLILKSQDSSTPITDESITRLNIPRKQGGKSSGFAYVDFTTPEHVQTAISLSEQNLNGRNLLIKDAHSFEGRPAKVDSSNPPSRILFIGNLSFETSEDDLTSHFQHCGEIGRIRMATFEDTGKCKGFAFIDFKDVEGATAALTDKKCRKLLGRDLRMEYGEDRSKRKPKSKTTESDSVEDSSETKAPISSPVSEPAFDRRKPKGPRPASNGRRTPGAALANAQRATSAIVASTGKKVTFD
jgi:RNA recognition motif-containing protein